LNRVTSVTDIRKALTRITGLEWKPGMFEESIVAKSSGYWIIAEVSVEALKVEAFPLVGGEPDFSKGKAFSGPHRSLPDLAKRIRTFVGGSHD
jgi:hypothetical protein